MKLLKKIGQNICSAVDMVVEKNRLAAQNNRLKMVIKAENNTITRAYIALGKHYYNTMKDSAEGEAAHLCHAIEQSRARIERVKDKLVALNCQDTPAAQTVEPAAIEEEPDSIYEEDTADMPAAAVEPVNGYHPFTDAIKEAADENDEEILPFPAKQ